MRKASQRGTTTSTSNRTWLVTPRGGWGNSWNLDPMRLILPKDTGPMVLLVLRRISSPGDAGELLTMLLIKTIRIRNTWKGVIWKHVGGLLLLAMQYIMNTGFSHSVDRTRSQYLLWEMLWRHVDLIITAVLGSVHNTQRRWTNVA